jgi:hypothetical protein
MIRKVYFLPFQIWFILIFGMSLKMLSQSAWPASTWTSAVNLTSVMDASGIVEASGLYWNKVTKRLYLVQNDGRIRVLQFNETTQTFTQVGNKTLAGGPEAVTLVNDTESVFYILDENNYEIKKYAHTSDFTSMALTQSWDLLTALSPMTDTGNSGPEGLAFIPDAYLAQAGFVSSVTGTTYTSQKGMGGLLFVAHQDGGYIWVFDVNPNVSNDFIYVGKYKTNREESCDLAFDASTGLLHILHNIDGNRLEVTDLSSTLDTNSERVMDMVSEYFLPVPTSNTNIEGFTLTEKCPDQTVSAWLCRDASSSESSAVKTDVLRWFKPFNSDGDCETVGLGEELFPNGVKVFPNPAQDVLTIESDLLVETYFIVDMQGRVLQLDEYKSSVDVSELQSGMYYLILESKSLKIVSKFFKE